jgi:hypothetical protein
MTTDWLETLHDVGRAVYEAFLLPGDFLLLRFAAQAPALALSLGIDSNSDAVSQSAILSAVVWLLLVGVVWKSFRILQNVSRSLLAVCKTIVFRTLIRIRVFKKKLLSEIQELLPRRRSSHAEANPEVEFDDIDLAVLRNSAEAGGGFVVSAPGLAELLSLRPDQVQLRLEWLRKYRMVEVVLGSTDGFDNYRLSPSGIAFLSALRQSRNREQPQAATSVIE